MDAFSSTTRVALRHMYKTVPTGRPILAKPEQYDRQFEDALKVFQFHAKAKSIERQYYPSQISGLGSDCF
jgi:lysozyme family protein